MGTEFGREKLCRFQTEKLLQTRRSAPRAELAAKLSGSWIHKGFRARDSCLSFRGGRRFLTEHSSERQTLIGEQPYGAEICLCQTSLAQIKCFSLKSASTLNPSACTGCFWCLGSTNRRDPTKPDTHFPKGNWLHTRPTSPLQNESGSRPQLVSLRNVQRRLGKGHKQG